MARQAGCIAYVSGAAFTNETVEALCDSLTTRTPGMDHAYILGSGSEATEAALKLARQHWVERGRPSKHRVIALNPSYHGNTMLALSVSARRRIDHWPGGSPKCDGSAQPSLRMAGGGLPGVSEAPRRLFSMRVADRVPHSSPADRWKLDRRQRSARRYLRRIREICDRYDVLFVADGCCGSGAREWTASQDAGVVPDIHHPCKAWLEDTPVSACDATVSSNLSLAERLVHAQTFSHHAVVCSRMTIGYIWTHGLVDRCRSIGVTFLNGCESLRGRRWTFAARAVAGVEFIAIDPRAPFRVQCGSRALRVAQDEGLIVWPNVGHADGVNGDLAMLAPPFIITEPEIDEIIERFRKSLARTMRETGAGAAAAGVR
jgi:adenosylmethionine-8-amino-7-oxononanoate aminotransferase